MHFNLWEDSVDDNGEPWASHDVVLLVQSISQVRFPYRLVLDVVTSHFYIVAVQPACSNITKLLIAKADYNADNNLNETKVLPI